MFINKQIQHGIFLLGIAAVMVGCSRNPQVTEKKPPEVVICQPLEEKIEDWDIYTGTVEAKDFVEIRSRVRGHIKEVLFKEGDEVEAGAPLFEIDSGPFEAEKKQAQGQLTNWEAKLKFADEKIALYKPLAEKGTVSKEELLQALGAKGEALGGIEAARGAIQQADLNIKYSKITSPIAGKAGVAVLTKGNLVNASGADSLLTTVIAVEPMYVNFNVNERAMLNYKKILREKIAKETKKEKNQNPVIPVELQLLGEKGFKHKGVVDFVDNRVDPTTGSIHVRAKFDNPKGEDGFRPLSSGLFARVRLSIAPPHPAILVADRAILTDQSLKYVLVVNKQKKNLVERKDIVVSDRVQPSGLREVEAGLNGTEWIIVEGVNRARPGITVSPKESRMPKRPTTGK